jgi:hypothetical protein
MPLSTTSAHPMRSSSRGLLTSPRLNIAAELEPRIASVKTAGGLESYMAVVAADTRQTTVGLLNPSPETP